MTPPLFIATRGSALALAQANLVLAQCREAFPHLDFQLKIIKTTGDKLQTAALANPVDASTKGLFTKELEAALLAHEADLAVHSLKDLPTDLPQGLLLGAVCKRADVRDVLIYRDSDSLRRQPEQDQTALRDWSPGEPVKRGFKPGLKIQDLPSGALIATSSTRRQAQILALRPDLRVAAIRGNVGTRLQKLLDQPEMDATILAAAGLQRLHFQIAVTGHLRAGPHPTAKIPPAKSDEDGTSPTAPVPPAILDGLLAVHLEPETMLPCVGQGAIGIETRENDERILPVCTHLNHNNTLQCVIAERAFLHAMGGGCQSPVAAYAQLLGHQILLRAVSFRDGPARRAEGRRLVKEAALLGEEIAARLSSP